jgi:hypothetical protein
MACCVSFLSLAHEATAMATEVEARQYDQKAKNSQMENVALLQQDEMAARQAARCYYLRSLIVGSQHATDHIGEQPRQQ